ncbi:hypothetical protein Syun_005308 [Stephania yunnanensis]|uniref:H15 domain-containing protein n=1 Tax=Stephania yunnanensis TaxID=152371 RepID=A0AAP0L4V0_9MAGN
MSAIAEAQQKSMAAEDPKKAKKTRVAKAPKEKKPKSAKASAPHPTYFQMIKDALAALSEKSGSSPYAIAKHMEEKHKAVLPQNFRKILALQLKNCAAKGKLIKIKASYKLSEEGKKNKADAKPVKAGGEKSNKKRKSPEKKTKTAKTTKTTKTVVGKKKKKTETPKKKVAAVKKVGVKKARKVTTPVKVKTLKSIKTPAKKARKA